MRRIAIIGAGASGLVSLKTCLEEGLEPVCYEKRANIGGLWFYQEDDPRDNPNGPGAVYQGMHTNISKENMAFSDFSLPKTLPPYPKASEVQKFYESYADHFELWKHIHFNVEVVAVEQTADYDQTGRWQVTIRDASSSSSSTRMEVFDSVIVCSGLYPAGRMPDYPGLDEFTGKIKHSCQVKKGSDFTDQRVLVVGSAISAGDISSLVSLYASQVYLSTRRGVWCVPRFFHDNDTLDCHFNQRWKRWLPSWFVASSFKRKLDIIPNEKLGTQCAKDPFTTHPMYNEILPSRIMQGNIGVRSGIERFRESEVIFVDGSVIDKVDCVIFATGYELKFPFFKKELIPDGYEKQELYLNIIPPRLKHPTLAFVGLCVPFSIGQNTLSEMQARFVAKVFNRQVKLPSQAEMEQEIATRRKSLFERFGAYFPWVVDPTMYRDQLAAAIGALPNLTKMILTDPKLAYHFYFRPAYPSSYRLVGPGAKPGAREAFLGCDERQVHGITLETVRRDAVKGVRQAQQLERQIQMKQNLVVCGAILAFIIYLFVF